MPISSAAGIISLLDEEDVRLKCAGLRKLESLVDSFWMEMADELPKIVKLQEDEAFPNRDLAALVASKVSFHLGFYHDSLSFALKAGDLFHIHAHSEFTEKIVVTGMDDYIKVKSDGKTADPRLEEMVDQIVDVSLRRGSYKEAIGIGLEARRLDILERAIKESGEGAPSLLAYSVRSTLAWNKCGGFKQEVLRCLVRLYLNTPPPDYINISQCFLILDDPDGVSDILEKLIRSQEENERLVAFQAAFDLFESATQRFIKRIIQRLQPGTEEDQTQRSHSHTPEDHTQKDTISSTQDHTDVEGEEADTDSDSLTGDDEAVLEEENVRLLIQVLDGTATVGLRSFFLAQKNKTDFLIIKYMKEMVRHNVEYTAMVTAQAFMNAGTSAEKFLFENLDWVKQSTNWAKFGAAASLGIIHKGREEAAMDILGFLLEPSETPVPESMAGGGLYALGLIHGNHGNDGVIDYLGRELSGAKTAWRGHGACLGLGLASMGTGRGDVYELLQGCLMTEDAVVGEAAGLAMGLVMLGTGNTGVLDYMISCCKETGHEKIQRGLSLGIGLVVLGREEESEDVIQSLLRDGDPLVRRAGVSCLAMGYAGTGRKDSLHRLLRLAVSDVNDDVRRSAAMSLGFILFKCPEKCVGMVCVLTESYNPHVRYGAAMALGIACAGKPLSRAIALLEPLMLKDGSSFVRQGSLIAMALILIQQNGYTCPKVLEFRNYLTKVMSDDEENETTKFGGFLAQGILDAGGRNVSLSLVSRTGQTDVESVVGMMVFLQHWNWFPLTHFLSLAFKPTCLIGLNHRLKIPEMKFVSGTRPSIFGYPPHLEERSVERKARIQTAPLSVSGRFRQAQAEASAKTPQSSIGTGIGWTEDKTEVEPNFEMLDNPARVMNRQLKYMRVSEESGYEAVRNPGVGGILLLMDHRPLDDRLLVKASVKDPNQTVLQPSE